MVAFGIIQLINLILLFGGVFGLVLLIIVLLKLNKALNIWLGKH